MSWFRRKKPRATLEAVTAVANDGRRRVQAAVSRCSNAQGDEQGIAWRELYSALYNSVSALKDVVAEEPEGTGLRRMAQDTQDELCSTAEPWLTLTVLVTHRPYQNNLQVSEMHGVTWLRFGAALTACVYGGLEAQARLREFLAEVKVVTDASAGLMSRNGAQMWQILADEFADQAADALAR